MDSNEAGHDVWFKSEIGASCAVGLDEKGPRGWGCFVFTSKENKQGLLREC